MRFVNPQINKVVVIKEPKITVTEAIRKIVCDKYGIESDCAIDEMIADIYETLFTINI